MSPDVVLTPCWSLSFTHQSSSQQAVSFWKYDEPSGSHDLVVIATLTSGDVYYFVSMGQTLCWPLDIYSDEEPVRKRHEDVKLCIKPYITGYGYRLGIHSHLSTSRGTDLLRMAVLRAQAWSLSHTAETVSVLETRKPCCRLM